MNNDFHTIIKETKYEQLFNPNQNYLSRYYDENEFIIYTIYQQAFPLVQVSHKRGRNKPRLTIALTVSIN